MSEPDAEMLALATAIARFIATGDDAVLEGVFADDLAIVENFPPHIFRDVATWRDAMRHHIHPLSDMAFSFAPAVDFNVHGERAYFCIPVTWTGKLHGRPFRELGGKSLVLQKENGAWRVAAYAWAVVEMRLL
ncbi:MAG TPA: hypothetical protein VGB91_05200 [Rhizomicrobium sp.]